MLTAATNKQGVSLSWKADDESDATAYRLQKSTDGIHFETIYSLNVQKGATPETHRYMDAARFRQKGATTGLRQLKNQGRLFTAALLLLIQ